MYHVKRMISKVTHHLDSIKAVAHFGRLLKKVSGENVSAEVKRNRRDINAAFFPMPDRLHVA